MSKIDIQSVTRHSVDFTNSTSLTLGDEYFHDKYAQVELMTTDRSTKYLVYALANGLVRIETARDPISLADYGSFVDLTEGLEKKRVEVIDLKIDDTDTWLAELRDDALMVWNLQQESRPALAFRVPVSTGTSLAFDHTGQILALATATEIRFYDLNKEMVVASIPVIGTSALNFTRDNRMLISGDATGNLYIWGDPKQ